MDAFQAPSVPALSWQADLHITAALLSAPDQPRAGEIKITLTAKKADVAPVTLPPASSG